MAGPREGMELRSQLPGGGCNAGTARLGETSDRKIAVRRPLRPRPSDGVQALFTANTLHIMGWTAVRDLFRGAGTVLSAPGTVCIYAPFRYGGRCTSNAEFDRYRSCDAREQSAARLAPAVARR